VKENSSRSWDWRREEGAGISPRNSILDVEECEGDGGETSGSKRVIVTEDGIEEDMGNTGSYLEREENISSDWRGNIRGRKRRKDREKV